MSELSAKNHNLTKNKGCQHCVSKKTGNFAKCVTAGYRPAEAQEEPAG